MATKSKSTTPRPAKKSTRTRRPARSTPKAAARPARRARPEVRTFASRVSRVLPQGIAQVEYVRRTLEIFDQRAKRAMRLRSQTQKELGSVVRDAKKDLNAKIDSIQTNTQERIDGVTERVRGLEVVKRVEAVPERITSAMDRWLERVGLVRKTAEMS